jgi:hypothetical protein
MSLGSYFGSWKNDSYLMDEEFFVSSQKKETFDAT